MDERDKADGAESGGTNARALNDTIAGTGPGIPDDALAPGEDLPTFDEDEVARIARKLGLPDTPSDRNRG